MNERIGTTLRTYLIGESMETAYSSSCLEVRIMLRTRSGFCEHTSQFFERISTFYYH